MTRVAKLTDALRNCSIGETSKPTYEQISAWIRIGHKYQLKGLYEQSLNFLKLHYTTDLRVWCESEHFAPPGWKEVCSIGVVNLARFINEPSILPTALLACTVMNAEEQNMASASNLGHNFARLDASIHVLMRLNRRFKRDIKGPGA